METVGSFLLALLLWVAVGALAGWIASLIMGTNRTQGFWADVMYGILGGVLGGLVLSLFGINYGAGFNAFLWSIVTAVVGAVILIAIVRAVQRKPLRGSAMQT